MRKKLFSFAISLFFILFLILLSLPTLKPSYALTDNCSSYNQWKNLPPINFSVQKNNNNTFTASITSSKSVMDKWQANVPNKDFQIHGFIGNVVYKNQLAYDIGKAILNPNGSPTSFRIVSFADGTALTPGQTYTITFRIFTAPIPDGTTLNACAIDSGAKNITYVTPQPQQPGDPNPPPAQEVCYYCPDPVYKIRVPNVDQFVTPDDDIYACQSEEFGLNDHRRPSLDKSCSEKSGQCSPTIGCTTGSLPDSCSQVGRSCKFSSECRRDGEEACSKVWCMSGSYLHPPTAGYTGTCTVSANKPECAAGTDCTDLFACITCRANSTYDSVRKTCIKTEDGVGQPTDPKDQTLCTSDQNCVQGKGCQERFTIFTPLDTRCDEEGENKKCNKINVGGITDIKTTVGGFVTSLLSILLSLSGGIAVILIIISGYRLMVSRGNPEQVQNAREQLTAAIVGLLFVIFSLVILTVIGINILGIF